MKHTDDLIGEYLRDLERELADLPRTARQDVVEEISQHIADDRAALTTESEAAVRAILGNRASPALGWNHPSWARLARGGDLALGFRRLEHPREAAGDGACAGGVGSARMVGAADG